VRIAFLNPWKNAAENQAFRSLQIAAGRVGHEFIHCRNSSDVDACAPDFVLASASTQPKLSDCPHYGVIHEPRDRFLDNRAYFQNLLSYDGYFTIADSLERFLRDISYRVGRPGEIGFYYNTCQRQQRSADLASLLRHRKLLLTYFGTNWDHRRKNFFRMLSEIDNVQICGPTHSWPEIHRKSYGGSLEFDGDAVQARYATNGLGLCLVSELHCRDDVISNRIFEIASVGAIAICCDMPWIRKYFGDSVYYIDQNLADKSLVRAILRCWDEIYDRPETALDKARRAREIFEQRFAAELLINNAVKYHERLSTTRHAMLSQRKASYQPFISVIIRCGGRPVDLIRRALFSLSQQTYGEFEVIFVRYKDLDLSPLLSQPHANVCSIKVVDCLGCGRSTALWTGLSAITGDYFAVLDDDDWLFSNHFEKLFQSFPQAPKSRFFAYSSSISHYAEPKPVDGGHEDHRSLLYFEKNTPDLSSVYSMFASNCFVASQDLLSSALLCDPHMSTAEDSFLILSLVEQARPHFSYAATSVHERGRSDQSDFRQHPTRFEDELTLRIRLGGRQISARSVIDLWDEISSFWKNRLKKEAVLETPDRIIYRVLDCPISIEPEKDRECVSMGFNLQGSKFSVGSHALDASVGSAWVQCPEDPWAYGAELCLRLPHSTELGHLLIAEIIVECGEIGIGLLNVSERDFLMRKSLQPGSRIQEVHIPIADLLNVGRFIVQNWQNPGPATAQILSLRICSE
jgi:hypothetical protein